jgi:hypothetical protein
MRRETRVLRTPKQNGTVGIERTKKGSKEDKLASSTAFIFHLALAMQAEMAGTSLRNTDERQPDKRWPNS